MTQKELPARDVEPFKHPGNVLAVSILDWPIAQLYAVGAFSNFTFFFV
jgi:hypothetical protein